MLKRANQESASSVSSILAQARAKAAGESNGQDSSNDGTSSGADSASVSNGIPKLQRKKNATEDGRKARLASLVRSAGAPPPNEQGLSLSSSAFSSNTSPEDFWKNLREWDFIADLSKQRQPADEDSSDKGEPTPKHKPIPDTFINHRHYVACWAPLCLAETRAQLLSDVITEYGQNNNRRFPPLLLVNVETTWKGGPSRRDQSLHTDLGSMDSCHVKISVKNRGEGGHLQFFTHDICFLVAVSHMNLVERLLSGGSITKTEETSYRKFGLIGYTEVTRKEVNGLILKVSKKRWAQAGNSEMYLLKIGGNVTALREFTALCGVERTPLKTFLLGHHLEDPTHRAKSREFARKGTEELLKKMGGVEALGKGFTEYAQQKFNPSQLKAISASAQGYGDGGFTLIKGPPGTGSK